MTIDEIIAEAQNKILKQTGLMVKLTYRKIAEDRVVKQHIIDRSTMAVSYIFGFDEVALYGKSRKHHLSDARFALWFLIREQVPISQHELGRRFSGRDHTSIMYGLQRCQDLIETEPDYAAKYNEAKRIIEEINA